MIAAIVQDVVRVFAKDASLTISRNVGNGAATPVLERQAEEMAYCQPIVMNVGKLSPQGKRHTAPCVTYTCAMSVGHRTIEPMNSGAMFVPGCSGKASHAEDAVGAVT